MVLAVTASGLMYYNWRSTGSPTTMPYQLNWERYHITKPFLWQSKRPVPEYNHPQMRKVYVYWELPPYLETRYRSGLEHHLVMQLRLCWRYWIYPLFPLLLIGVWYATKKPRLRIFAIAFILVLALLLSMTWPVQPFYAGGVYPAVLAMLLFGLRLLRVWDLGGRRVGLALSYSVVAVVFVLCAARVGLALTDGQGVVNLGHSPFNIERSRIRSQLEKLPGKHLVIVYYRLDHGPQEWVYNSANIDDQRVVWARNMGVQKNQELLDYYKHRQVWVIDADERPLTLHHYQDVSAYLDGTDGLGAPITPLILSTRVNAEESKTTVRGK